MGKGQKIEKVEKILVFSLELMVFGLGVKKQRDEKLFCLIKKKNEMMKNIVCINLLTYPYQIKKK